MTTPGPDNREPLTDALDVLQEEQDRQAVAFDRYREALLAKGLPPALNPHRQVPRGR